MEDIELDTNDVKKPEAGWFSGARRSRLAQAFNFLASRFRIAIVFKNNRWRITTGILKENRVRSAHSTGTVKWRLRGASPLALDDNLVRGLISQTDIKRAKNRKKRKAKARRYIAPKIGVAETFKRLNEVGIKYVVLRWFDTLPNVEPGEDIDILIADEAIEHLESFFLKKRVKGAIPCDIYSESGVRGTDFGGLPYYEKRLATEILDNAVLHNKLVKVPSAKHHLLSLAYHVLYHKAQASGLPFDNNEPPMTNNDEHNYADALSKLASGLNISITTTLIGLNEALDSFDWNPSTDTIRKLALKRPVLNELLKKRIEDEPLLDAEVSAFVIRDWAYKRNLLPWILSNIRHFGFDIKAIRILNPAERERARLHIRSGNWNQGPYPVSGGDPAAIIAICDYAPEPVRQDTLEKQPYVKNERLVDLKRILRDGINSYLPKGLRVNALHSADDQAEALHYLSILNEDLPKQFIALCQKGYEGDPYTRLILHEGKRATTYVVFRNGRPCKLKVFSDCDDGRQSLRNENKAKDAFSGQSWFPKTYESGANWTLQEYFDQESSLDRQITNMTEHERTILAGKIISIISQIHNMGYAHRDIHGGNFFIVDGVVKLIDYETLTEEDKNIPLEECYDITGKGLDSPFLTAQMCYTNTKEPLSLNKLLDVSFADAYRNMQTKQ